MAGTKIKDKKALWVSSELHDKIKMDALHHKMKLQEYVEAVFLKNL